MTEDITYPGIVRDKELTYGEYLKIPEILSLQKPLSQPPHHDENLFIIIHQTYELWFKLILLELEQAATHMKEKDLLGTHHFLNRVNQVMKLMVNQIHLLETMRPMDFLEFRTGFGPASGFQSLQFRELEFFSGLKDDRYFKYLKDHPEMVERLEKRKNEPDLRTHFYLLLKDLGFEIPPLPPVGTGQVESKELKEALISQLKKVFESYRENMDLYLVVQDLIEYDENLMLWRFHHVRVVERLIGRKMGSGGSEGIDYLSETLKKRCFPLLWEVASRIEKK